MLTALSYHLQVKDYFKHQSKTWEYFCIDKNKDEQLLEFKTELLKNTYKFDPATEPRIYDNLAIAKNTLGLGDLPVTVYQSQHSEELNASIVYLNNEAHIVFTGPVIKLLDDEELLAVLSHELTHVKLYSMLNGDLEVADRIVTAIANNYNTEPSYYETARLFRLYTEIFCDRGAYTVLQNTDPVITSLVKIVTGLDTVNASNYVKQANEIFAADNAVKTAGISHPENFIRAKAIQLWHEKKEAADEEIVKMIEGSADLDRLDIFQQKELTLLTRQFLQLYLKPNWFRTTLVISLAKQYFPDFSWDENIVLDDTLTARLAAYDPSIKEYLACIILDFALSDNDIEDVSAGWAIEFSENVQFKELYDNLLKKELKLSEKKLQQYKQKMTSAYHSVKEGENEQILK
jgi:hypothetical protein